MIDFKKLEELELLHLLSGAMDMIVKLEEGNADTYLINYAKRELFRYTVQFNNNLLVTSTDDSLIIRATNKMYDRICAVTIAHLSKRANQVDVDSKTVRKELDWLFSKHEELREKTKDD